MTGTETVSGRVRLCRNLCTALKRREKGVSKRWRNEACGTYQKRGAVNFISPSSH
ncbi:hypothetical protein DOFOFD_09075 [Acetobacteraceae bacterium EV16P]|uniref:Uncharacterized protein n=1 Tax=Sorlinia euscelidii TaxID=3081148 RepID=A0ABU7U2T1_9PROT